MEFKIINDFHIELGHTIEEYNDLYGKEYENGEFWDFSIEDVENGAIEANPNMIYWQIGNRVYETYKFEEFEE